MGEAMSTVQLVFLLIVAIAVMVVAWHFWKDL